MRMCQQRAAFAPIGRLSDTLCHPRIRIRVRNWTYGSITGLLRVFQLFVAFAFANRTLHLWNLTLMANLQAA